MFLVQRKQVGKVLQSFDHKKRGSINYRCLGTRARAKTKYLTFENRQSCKHWLKKRRKCDLRKRVLSWRPDQNNSNKVKSHLTAFSEKNKRSAAERDKISEMTLKECVNDEADDWGNDSKGKIKCTSESAKRQASKAKKDNN